MFGELMRLAPRSVPEVEIVYASFEALPGTQELRAWLDAAHTDTCCVVAANAHIEVFWNFSKDLFTWCQAHTVPAYVYAHDYWPHHKDNLLTLTGLGASILASTPSVAATLREAGFRSEVVAVGVPLPEAWPALRAPASPKCVASVGRLVPRKRFSDLVRAFAESGLDGQARLYLRVLPSHVFSATLDDEQLRAIEAEIERGRLTGVVLDRQPGDPPNYTAYSAYVCASSYEGFSMTVIEAAFYGCPPLMSDIAPHRSSARILFGSRADEFLYPAGDHRALAHLLRDEIVTGWRRQLIGARISDIRATIASRWSLGETARALARVARRPPG
jgi:glycosyltransferase involved in cell wall biosynthesis